MHLIITCLLPRQHLSCDLGGWDKAAVVLDTDHTFDVHRLRQLIIGRLERHVPLDAAHSLAQPLLSKVHVFRPDSLSQLALTILNLPEYHRTQLSDTEIGLVAVDSISAFYWQDRLHVEQTRSQITPQPPFGIEFALKALERFRQSHGPVTVLTNWALSRLSKTSPFYRQHVHALHSPFSSTQNKSVVILPLTHHITLQSIEDEEKNQVVEGLVRTVGFDNVGKFTFRITSTDVV